MGMWRRRHTDKKKKSGEYRPRFLGIFWHLSRQNNVIVINCNSTWVGKVIYDQMEAWLLYLLGGFLWVRRVKAVSRFRVYWRSRSCIVLPADVSHLTLQGLQCNIQHDQHDFCLTGENCNKKKKARLVTEWWLVWTLLLLEEFSSCAPEKKDIQRLGGVHRGLNSRGNPRFWSPSPQKGNCRCFVFGYDVKLKSATKLGFG